MALLKRNTSKGRRIISLMAVSLVLTTLASTAQADNPTTGDGGDQECLSEHTVLISSDTETMVTAGNTGLPVPHPAELAWEPRSDTDPSHWDTNVDYDFVAADWIWEAYRVVNPHDGDIVEFERTFSIPGDPIAGSLVIVVDNGYEAYMNDTFLGTANLSGDWRSGDLSYPLVDGTGWRTVFEHDVTDGLVSGDNVLAISAANEYADPSDEDNSVVGTISSNPGGVIYELEITYQTDPCEPPPPPCPDAGGQQPLTETDPCAPPPPCPETAGEQLSTYCES